MWYFFLSKFNKRIDGHILNKVKRRFSPTPKFEKFIINDTLGFWACRECCTYKLQSAEKKTMAHTEINFACSTQTPSRSAEVCKKRITYQLYYFHFFVLNSNQWPNDAKRWIYCARNKSVPVGKKHNWLTEPVV